jgi:hypothetical protein
MTGTIIRPNGSDSLAILEAVLSMSESISIVDP